MGLTKTFKDGTTPVVCIIGSGFSGMCAAIRLQTQLNLKTYTIFELEPELGGTWWSNTYPGCACDVKSINYQFSFEPNYEWSKTYAGQQEIWEYQRRVAKKYNLYEKIRFRTEVTHAEWYEDLQQWVLDWTNHNTGEIGQTNADVVFSGMGPLRVPQIPKQFEAFEGPKWHTAQWNHDYDLAGKRVAVVGSGASSIQVVPAIVDKVKKLEFYQRSATYIVPRRNATNSALWKFLFKYIPFIHFLYYKLTYWSNEFIIRVFSTKWQHALTRRVAMLLAWSYRFYQIRDKQLRIKLTPNYILGCRRIVVSSDYYPALARKNVRVHTATIKDVKGQTLMLSDGSRQEVDALVLATGFHVQDILAEGFVIGKDKCDLFKVWGQDPKTYYGITSAETPNMFFLLGPNTGLGHNSVLFMIETACEYAIMAISHMMNKNLSSIQATPKACKDFVEEVEEKMKDMVWSSNCKSWYQNEQGKVTALWWSTCTHYWWRLRKFRPEHFVSVQRSEAAAAIHV
ncbi:MAG: monooxygenase [Linnemannia elongata]|nr:MAG: monooxygenase [Linnemannia elongata]